MADASRQDKEVPDAVHIGPAQDIEEDAPGVADSPGHQKGQSPWGEGGKQRPRLEHHRPAHHHIAEEGKFFKPPQADGVKGDAHRRRPPDGPKEAPALWSRVDIR